MVPLPDARSISDAPVPNPLPADSWNVLATAKDHQQQRLARRLRRFGDFHWTSYRGLLAGRVEDHEAFFVQLLRCEEAEPGFLDPLARVVPIARTFVFRPETLLSQLHEAIFPWASEIDSHGFYVRCERRGHAGLIHGHEVERALDAALQDSLRARGQQPRVDFKDPEIIIAIELMDDVCGIGLVKKALRVRFPFVHIS